MLAEKAYWIEVFYKDKDTKPKKWRFVTKELRSSAVKAMSRDNNVKRIREYRDK